MNQLIKIGTSLVILSLLSACSSDSSQPNTDAKTFFSNVNTYEPDEKRYAKEIEQAQDNQVELFILPTQIELLDDTSLPVSKSNLSQAFTNEITNVLHQSKRFDILSFSGSNSDNQADFYLKNTITQLDTHEDVRTISSGGVSKQEKRVAIEVMYQILESKTNRIVINNTVRYQLNDGVNSEDLNTAVKDVVSKISVIIKDKLVEEMYPIKVLNNDNGQIILNQPLAVGSECEVLRPRYNSQFPSQDSSVVGSLIVINTTGTLSYAKIAKGAALAGDFCKPTEEVTTPLISAPELIRRTPQGGVVLPFD